MQVRNQVFISYSHQDKDHLERLKVHLRPLEREGNLDVWADTKISPGQLWNTEIELALQRAAVAILLVSADFLASDFVAENELPNLLAAAQSEGVKILPVILKPCTFTTNDNLSKFQAVNNPSRPLISMTESDREQLWVSVANEARLAINEWNFRNSSPFSNFDGVKFESIDFRIFPDLAMEILASGEFNYRGEVSAISNYHVYTYEHIDIQEFMPLAEKILGSAPNFSTLLQAVKRRLSEFGWEGDGEIRLLWIPPFMDLGVEDTFGQIAWFVKQSNNGTSFIASPVPLLFPNLLRQQLHL